MPTLPISPVKMPSTLTGQSNGMLPSSILDLIGVGTARMETTAARAFRAMFAHARHDLGVVIKHVGDYRTFSEQLNLFLSRYKPVSYSVYASTSSAHRKIWREASNFGYVSIYWIKKDERFATAAVPGASNHGWGLALDVAQEYDGDSNADPITSLFVNWLIANASRYGVSAELQSEPWHWRYFAGDNIPAAVLAYEANTQPPQEGDDVKIIAADRLLDTRGGTPGVVDDTYKVKAGTEHRVPIPGAAGQLVAQVTFTTMLADSRGYLTVWASGPRPETSFLNFPTNAPAAIPETLLVPLAPDGSFMFYSSARVHLLIDSTGVLLS